MPILPSPSPQPGLLARLRAADDTEGWLEFYRTCGELVRRFARRGGLTVDEADDVVQETAIGVARHLRDFHPDPARCAFQTWMLNLARWRTFDALRRRRALVRSDPVPEDPAEGRANGPDLDRIPDPHVPDFGAEGDATWVRGIERAALDRVRRSSAPEHFRIFDLYVLKGRPAREVAARVGVRVARVYLVKQRLSARLRREARRLGRETQSG